MQIAPRPGLTKHSGWLLITVVAVALVAAPGCGTLATVAYWIKGGDRMPAKFAGLKGKRVAVVCLDTHSLGGPGGEADAIGKAVALTLGANVPDVGSPGTELEFAL